MTGQPATLSLIVPTRGRAEQLRRLLASLAETAAHPEALEVVVVADEDDPASHAVRCAGLNVRTVIVPPGLTMGALNTAGYEASSGRYLMLLNDDVLARTPGWDERVLACFRACPDEVVLVHVNDLIFGDELCTFPVVSRCLCELAGGICPREYVRYRIDDHIGDLFNLLAVLGERRTFYLRDVVFEHRPGQGEAYRSDPAILAGDAARFEALFPQRKELALALKGHIDAEVRKVEMARHRQQLESIRDPFSLRVPQRLRTEADTPVTVAVVAEADEPAWRRCLASLRAHTTACELIVLDHGRALDSHVPRELNRLLDAARTDAVVLLWGPVVVGAGWLERLLGCLGPDVGMVVPLSRGRRAPLALLERARTAVRFDPTYRRHFFDLDLDRRVRQCGLRLVSCPCPEVEVLPRAEPFSPEVCDADRRCFAGRWGDPADEAVGRPAGECFFGRLAGLLARARRRFRREGYRGLARAVARRVGLGEQGR